jgi:hypothetical protein
MLLKDFTPLLGSANQIRAARGYTGGRNLDLLVGEKTTPEEGWHYPEAWIFSPDNSAINHGSQRKEGETFFYDADGNVYSWTEYIKKYKEILGGKKMSLCVKLLDSDCTLPKEIHFREEDIPKLKEYPLLENFSGTFIKPEVWIRHPSANDVISPAYVGFNKRLTQEKFFEIVKKGVKEMEKNMNPISLNKGEAIYIPGGTVHSLGKGLYFEVLAAGDLKITLQDEFAGRKLSLKEQLHQVYKDDEMALFDALEFIDYSRYGERTIKEALKKPAGGKISNIIKNNYFSADWIRIKPNEKVNFEGNFPHILVTATGNGKILSKNSKLFLQTKATNFNEFKKTNSCYALVVHNSTKQYVIENEGESELILLRAY